MSRRERDRSVNEATLVELIQRAQSTGDPAAFEELYTLYADKIYRFLLVRLQDVDLAEELTSQVFLRLIERIHQYHIQPRDNVVIFSGWLYQIARHLLTDMYRAESRRTTVSLDKAMHLASPQEAPHDAVERKLTMERVVAALANLNERQQQVITLRFLEGLSVAETARVMHMTEGAVKALQHRALRNLQNYLAPEIRS
ncbi:MAG: sigma-70 family RNA polymerase sigma factor [Ardenticatenia bacterium]|nr:sigma-70 family RNA polymerase sigma factor [Ardenticatenia bacterium]